jgi:AcrR family transcriptional regulator
MSETPVPTSPHNGNGRGRGRPRDEGADDRILGAAIDLLADGGVAALTMSAVIERSGVARATVYRRWPTREAMIAGALREVKGRPPFPLSGDLKEDVANAVQQARAILATGRFQAILPALVQEFLHEDDGAASKTFDRVAPNHRRVADEYDRLAAKAGLRADVDGALVSDIAIGALLCRLLSTGRAPSQATADQLLDVILYGILPRPGRPARPKS